MATQLDTPSGLACTYKTATSLTFTWNPVSNAVEYILTLYKGPYSQGDKYSRSCTYTFTNLEPNTKYNVRVRAKSGNQSLYTNSSYSGAVSATTNATEPLTMPTGLTHSNVTSTGARIGWNSVENASGYKVEIRQGGGVDRVRVM